MGELGTTAKGLFECGCLLLAVLDAGDGPEDVSRESRRVGMLVKAKNALLDAGGEAQEHEHLRYAGTGDAFAASESGLALDFAGIELPLPLDGLAEGLDHGRRPGRLELRGHSDGGGKAVDGGFAWQLSLEVADVPVLERAPWPQGDVDSLGVFCEGVPAVLRRNVYDAEVDFWGRGGPQVRRGSYSGDLVSLPTNSVSREVNKGTQVCTRSPNRSKQTRAYSANQAGESACSQPP